MDPDSIFRQKPAGSAVTGQPQQAVDANPSEQSGTNVRIGTPVWRSFVANKEFQDNNVEAVRAEQDQMRAARIENRRAARQAEQQPEIWKGANGRLLRKVGRQVEDLNPLDFVDHPTAGPEARRSLWDSEIRTAKKEAEDASFTLKNPAFHAKSRTDKRREEIAMELDGMARQIGPDYEADPGYKALKQELIDDDEYRKTKAELAQRSYDSEAKARQIEGTDPESWWQSRSQPTEQDRRAAAVAQTQAKRADAQAADQSAAEEEQTIRAELAKGVKGPDIAAKQARLAEIAAARGAIAQESVKAEEPVKAVQAEAEFKKAHSNGPYPLVDPDPSTLAYFKANTHVTGMAMGAGLNDSDPSSPRTVMLNPYSGLSQQQQGYLIENERMRHFMDESGYNPSFKPTSQQIGFFKGEEYGKPENEKYLKQTIIARILTGDESAGDITPEQEQEAQRFAEAYKRKMQAEAQAKQQGIGDFLRGAEVSLKQIPQLGYGVAGLIGDTLGIDSLKDWGFKGYKEAEEKAAPLQRENDDVSKAWEKAKAGDIGALVDWAQYGLGYALGQAAESAAVAAGGAIIGGAVGGTGGSVVPVAGTAAGGAGGAATGAVAGLVAKGAVKTAAKSLIEKAISSQALKIAAKQLGKGAAEESVAKLAASQAVKKAAGARLGQMIAVGGNSLAMELGSIYPEAAAQAASEGRTLTGTDIARIWGSGVAAGALEGATDMLGLDLVTGKLRGALPDGRIAAGAVAGLAGIVTEGATEVAQTGIERFGARKAVTGEEAVNEYVNAGALGALGGGVIGVAGGFVSGGTKPDGTPITAPDIKPDVDSAIAAIDPELPPADPVEIERASMLGYRSPDDLAEGVLIERELAAIEAEDDQAVNDAAANIEAVRATGDAKATKAAEEQAAAIKPRAPAVRAVLKIASGQQLDDLTSAELAGIGMEETKTGFKPIKDAPQMIRSGADDSVILTDEALKAVESVSPRARGRVKMTESEAIQKAKDRAAQQLSTDTPDGGQGDPDTGFPAGAGVSPIETKGAVEFDVPTRSGKMIRVQAATAAEAEQEAAAQADFGDSIVPGQATPVQPQQTNEQQTQADRNPATGEGIGGESNRSDEIEQNGPGNGDNRSGNRGNAGGEGEGQLLGGDQVLPVNVGNTNESRPGNPETTGKNPDKENPGTSKAKGKAAPTTKSAETGSKPGEKPAGKPAPGERALALARKRIEAIKKKSKRLAEAIQETVDPTKWAEMTLNGKFIFINVERIIKRAIQLGMTEAQAAQYLARVLDEEIRHMAHNDAAIKQWEASGSELPFEEWRAQHYAEIWEEEFVKTGKAAHVRALYSRDVTDQKTQNFDSLPKWQKAFEAIRMMSQKGKVTETSKLWTNIGPKLREALQAALDALKQFSDIASPTLKSEITNLENALKQLTDSQPRGGNPKTGRGKPASGKQGDGTRGKAEGKRDSGAPDDGRTERAPSAGAGSPFVVGARVEFKWRGRTLTGEIRLAQNGALSIYPDENPSVSVGPVAENDARVIESPKVPAAAPESTKPAETVQSGAENERQGSEETTNLKFVSKKAAMDWMRETGIRGGWLTKLDTELFSLEVPKGDYPLPKAWYQMEGEFRFTDPSDPDNGFGLQGPFSRQYVADTEGLTVDQVKKRETLSPASTAATPTKPAEASATGAVETPSTPNLEGTRSKLGDESTIKDSFTVQLTEGDRKMLDALDGLFAAELPASEKDSEYLAAVERGDMETAQRMVDEAARKAGYNQRAYHGTWRAGFTVFKDLTHFSPDKTYADRYQSTSASSMGISGIKEATDQSTYEVFLKMRKPFDTRQAKARKLFNDEFLGKWGNGTPIGERGLPDWTDSLDLAEWLNEEYPGEFDSFILDEGAEPTESGEIAVRPESFVPLDPRNIKSADPVTYDADGNVIPLSRRFNPASDSILYASGLPDTFAESIPQDRFMALMDAASTWNAEGITSPESLAAKLDGIVDGRLRKFSQSIWFALKAVGVKGEAEPDWASIYASTNQDATDENGPRTVEGAGEAPLVDGQGGVQDGQAQVQEVKAEKKSPSQIAADNWPEDEAGQVLSMWKDAETRADYTDAEIIAAIDKDREHFKKVFSSEEDAADLNARFNAALDKWLADEGIRQPSTETEQSPAPTSAEFKALPAEEKKKAIKARKESDSIDDFGEKIGGARKDRWKERGLTTSDLGEMTDEERQTFITKAHVFGSFDYEKLVEDGMPAKLAWIVKQIKDKVATVPESAGKRASESAEAYAERSKLAQDKYVELVSKLRDRLKAARSLDDIKAAFDTVFPPNANPNIRRFNGPDSNNENAILIGGRNLISALQPSAYDLTKAERVVSKTGWPSKENTWKKKFRVQKQSKGSDIYENGKIVGKTEADSWYVTTVAKRGWGEIVGKDFESEEAAETFAKEQAGAKGGASGTRITRPYNPDLKRTGPAVERNEAVTGQDLLDAFGFRGGEFGKWTNEADRQQSLNQAYDGLMDLARVLGIPPKALSLNGALGIAFGARGNGSGAAHYEPGKIVINLTKTNGAGSLAHEWGHAVDDHFGKIATGKAANYLSHSPKQGEVRPEVMKAWADVMSAITTRNASTEATVAAATAERDKSVRNIKSWLRDYEKAADTIESDADKKEISDAIETMLLGVFAQSKITGDQLIDRINSVLKKNGKSTITGETRKNLLGNIQWLEIRSRNLEKAIAGEITRYEDTDIRAWSKKQGKSSENYWNRLHELFARSFESYVAQTLEDAGDSSPYLVQGIPTKAKAVPQWEDAYPRGKDAEAIHAAFKELFDVIETVETDKGTGLRASDLPPSEPQTLDTFKKRGRAAFETARPLIENAEEQMKAFGSGSMGVDPKFANFGGKNQDARDLVDIVRAYDSHAREIRADRDTFTKARELLAKDPAGVEELAMGAFGDGRMNIADHEQLAIEMFIQDRIAKSGDDRQAQIDNFVLIQANIMNRRETARTLRIGYDKFMKPEERALQQLADAIYRVNPKVEAKAKTLPLSERKAYLAEAGAARIAEVEKRLKKMGLRLSQVIGKNRSLQLENSRITREMLKTRDLMDQAIVKMVQKGATIADIRRRYGKDAAENAQSVVAKAREEIGAKLREMMASGMNRDQIREAMKEGLRAAQLSADSAMSPGDIDAMVNQMLAEDFGLPDVIAERPLPTVKPKAPKGEKLPSTNPLSSNWSRPEFTDGMNSYEFDAKDRAGIMERVEIIRGLAGAMGKIDGLTGPRRERADAKLKEINDILAKYGTDAAGIFEAAEHGKGIESYGFDVTDIAHVAAVARAINAIDADVVDKASEYLYASMLSGLQTMLVNATAIVPAVWESTVGRGVSMAINQFVKDPMAEQFGEAKYILKALAPAITRAKSNFQASMAAQHPMFDRDVNAMEVDWDKILGGGNHRMIGSISGKKGDIVRIPMRLLTATDDFNRTLIACCEVGTFAYRVGLAKSKTKGDPLFGKGPGTPEFDRFIRQEVNTPGSFSYQLASKKASSAIYSNPLPGQNDPHTGKAVPVNDLGDAIGYIAGKITDAVSKEHESLFLKAVAAAFRISFFPFQRTPFNIIRKGIRHTLNPFSLFDIGLGIVQNSRGTNPDGTGKWEWNAKGRNPELIERAGQQLQGAILMGILVATASGEGDDDDMEKPFVITGSLPFLPTNMAERDARMRSGIGAFRISFRRGDGSERFGFSYGRMEPVATLLSATIDTIKSVKRSYRAGGSTYDAAASAMGGLASQAQDKTFMRGVGDLIGLVKNIVSEPDIKENRKALQFLAGRVAMVVPNIIKQPIREVDPQFRDRADGFMQEMLYQAFPYGQKEAKTDPYGRTLEKPGTMASRPLDVADTGTDKVHPIDAMLIKWADSGNWKNAEDPKERKPWFPSPILNAEFKHPKTGENVKMNAAQLAEFREQAGKRATALLKLQKLNMENPTERDVEKVKEIISKSRSDMKKVLSYKFARQQP